MADWIYILNPNKDTLDGEPSDKETMHRLAEEDPGLELWLSRRNRMKRGDRLWFFFTHPESAVAAVAEVNGEPWENLEDPGVPYLVGRLCSPRRRRRCTATRGPGRAGARAGAVGAEGEAGGAFGAAGACGALTGRATIGARCLDKVIGMSSAHLLIIGDRAALSWVVTGQRMAFRPADQGGADAGRGRRDLPLHDARLLPEPDP
ncbi:hypothetical protein ACR6C2_39985 [Streptomyces sp. INA 01156]